MKLKSILSLLFVSLIIQFIITSCKLKNETSQSFLIAVDSIKVADTVTAKMQFEVQLYGTIGPDNCYSFEKFYNYPSFENEITIEAWGRYYNDGTSCGGSIVYLNKEMEMTISVPGIYNLRTLQPDGRYLEKKLTVIQ